MAQETIDRGPARPTSSATGPKNFDMSYQGDVSVRQALQLSLNVPAVRLLDAVGPARLPGALPPGRRHAAAAAERSAGPGHRARRRRHHRCATWSSSMRRSPIGGKADPLSATASRAPAPDRQRRSGARTGRRLAGHRHALRRAAAARRRDRGIAYKTGTSYGYRDAWSVGYRRPPCAGRLGRPRRQCRHSRPDRLRSRRPDPVRSLRQVRPRHHARCTRRRRARCASRNPNCRSAIERFARTRSRPRRGRPPVSRRRRSSIRPRAPRSNSAPPAPPTASRRWSLKLQGGRAPSAGSPTASACSRSSRRRTAQWTPDGAGYSTLTVIDAVGRACERAGVRGIAPQDPASARWSAGFQSPLQAPTHPSPRRGEKGAERSGGPRRLLSPPRRRPNAAAATSRAPRSPLPAGGKKGKPQIATPAPPPTSRRSTAPSSTSSPAATATVSTVPSRGAASTSSIFIASMVTSGSPLSTVPRESPGRGARAPASARRARRRRLHPLHAGRPLPLGVEDMAFALGKRDLQPVAHDGRLDAAIAEIGQYAPRHRSGS